MNTMVFIGCLILAVGVLLRFWTFDKKCEFRAIVEILDEDFNKKPHPTQYMRYWYLDQLSLLARATTHASMAMITFYHEVINAYPMSFLVVSIAVITTFVEITLWMYMDNKYIRLAKVFQGTALLKAPIRVLFLVKFQKSI